MVIFAVSNAGHTFRQIIARLWKHENYKKYISNENSIKY